MSEAEEEALGGRGKKNGTRLRKGGFGFFREEGKQRVGLGVEGRAVQVEGGGGGVEGFFGIKMKFDRVSAERRSENDEIFYGVLAK